MFLLYQHIMTIQLNWTNLTISDVSPEKHGNSKDFVHVILGIGFVLLSLTLLMLLSYAFIKNLKKHKPCKLAKTKIFFYNKSSRSVCTDNLFFTCTEPLKSIHPLESFHILLFYNIYSKYNILWQCNPHSSLQNCLRSGQTGQLWRLLISVDQC